MYKCLIDNSEFETQEELHNYISRRLKVKLEVYYPQYVPRYDLLTHELITFKNHEFYFHSLFNTRANLIEYFKKNSKDIKTLKECLSLRKQAKNLKYAPSTVEARTSILPTPLLVNRMGYDYCKICEELGMTTRYNYGETLSFENSKKLEVIIDSREQRPLIFDNSIVNKIDIGDYVSTSHFNNIFLERKSICDLAGTLSKGYERFQKELGRAKEMGSYLVVISEESLSQFLKVGKTPSTLKVQASPEFLSKRMRNLCQQFDNVQFVFTENRIQMRDLMEKIFRMTNNIREIDIQFYVDSKLI